MKRILRFIFSIFTFLTAVPLTARSEGQAFGKAPESSQKPEPSQTVCTPRVSLRTIYEISELARKVHPGPVNEKQMLEGALNGLLSSLDPHSSYLTAEDYQSVTEQTNGAFGGLGMEVTMEDGVVKIIAPIDDTPAFKAGLQSQDLIIAVDGKPVLGQTLYEAVRRMRGKPNTSVKLLIKRKSKDPFEVTIKRSLIAIQSVKWRIEDDVGYVRVSVFDTNVKEKMRQALVSFQKHPGKKLAGVVIDLRNNAGGLFHQALGMCELFLDQGLIVSTRGRHEEEKFHISKGRDLLKGVPVVVLINGGSASASEIVAGALQDHGRALIVGTPSFGKGSVQKIFPLRDGGAVKITIARYYTPSGRSIQATGIKPDVMVEPMAHLMLVKEHGNLMRERGLSNALKAEVVDKKGKSGTQKSRKDEKNSENSSSAKTKERPSSKPSSGSDRVGIELDPVRDYQLVRAIDFVKGIDIYRRRLYQPMASMPAKGKK